MKKRVKGNICIFWNSYPLKLAGVVIFLLTIAFITCARTSYVGPESSLDNFPAYLVSISSLKINLSFYIFHLWIENKGF